jgi:uncharacterized Zn-finger protein
MHMKNQDIIYVNDHKVKCEGETDSSGHPRVYLEINQEQITCPYCSKTFKLKK